MCREKVWASMQIPRIGSESKLPASPSRLPGLQASTSSAALSPMAPPGVEAAAPLQPAASPQPAAQSAQAVHHRRTSSNVSGTGSDGTQPARGRWSRRSSMRSCRQTLRIGLSCLWTPFWAAAPQHYGQYRLVEVVGRWWCCNIVCIADMSSAQPMEQSS